LALVELIGMSYEAEIETRHFFETCIIQYQLKNGK